MPTPQTPIVELPKETLLSLQQFLVFEISPVCNMAKVHDPACPSGNPLRWALVDKTRPISDDLILDCCRQAYGEMGFRGQVAWHYYCEPMLAWPRLKALIPRIKAEIPQSRFCLWTNGTRMPKDLNDLKIFETVWISNYHNRDWSAVKAVVPDTRILNGVLDSRTAGHLHINMQRCLRPFNELILDHYGNGRLCCMEWRGEVPLGNVWDIGLHAMAERFVRIRDKLAKTPIAADSPTICKTCAYRQTVPGTLVAGITEQIRDHVGV